MKEQLAYLPIRHAHHNKNDIRKTERVCSDQDIKQYFNSKIQSTRSRTALKSVERIDTKINEEIEQGSLYIPNQSQNLSDILLEQRITKEQKKAMKLRVKRQEINITLQYLDMQIRGNNASQLNTGISSGNILSKKQHNQIMKKIRTERRKTQQRRLKLQQSLEKQRQQKQLQQKKLHEIAIQNDKQYRRKKIQERSKQHEQHQALKSAKRQQEHKKEQEIKKKKFLYEKMEEEYQSQVILPNLQENKRKLKEIRKMKALNIDEIKTHQQQYMKKKQENSSNHSRLNTNWHYKAPEKSEKLLQLIQSQQIQLRKQLLEKKRIIQENIAKQQVYVQYLKQKFPPKANEKRKEQLIKRINNLHTQKRESSDYKEIGNAYLDQIRMKNSRNTQNPEDYKSGNRSLVLKKRYEIKTEVSGKVQYKNSYTNYLKRPTNRNYTQLRRKKIEKLIQSTTENPEQKITYLNIQYKKLNEQAKRKEQLLKVSRNDKIQQQAIDLLLDSIKAKMSLMQIYNKGQ